MHQKATAVGVFEPKGSGASAAVANNSQAENLTGAAVLNRCVMLAG
jgi:hypothetical protein